MQFIDFEYFKSQDEVYEAFATEDHCVSQLELLRWDGDVISPFDPASKVYACKNGRYRCRNTGKYFNVKTNTIFHNTKVELSKWFQAIWLCTQPISITAMELSKNIGVTPKTAGYMQKRIRKYINTQTPQPTTMASSNQLAITDWLTQLK